MTTPAIRVENLGKKYLISHQQRERYTALRDVLTNKAKGLGRRIIDLGRAPVTRRASREEFWALKDVSFEVQPGERIGIIGRNGAGKSTLLKLLSRITEPSAGRIELQGRVASLLEVGTGFHPELTGRENIFLNGAILGMSKEEIKRNFDEIVAFAEVEQFLDTPVKRYSSGMYVRLAFAVAAHLQTEILLIDEVLAVGDAEFQKRCLGKIEEKQRGGRTVLFVSHRMDSITRLCPTALLLRGGSIEIKGQSPEVVNLYLKADGHSSCRRTWKGPNRPGNDIVRLLEVTVHDASGEEHDTYDICEAVGVSMAYEVLSAGHLLSPAFNFIDAAGVNIFDSHDTTLSWRRKTKATGLYKSTVWVPANLLAEGPITVGAAIITPDPFAIHFHEMDVACFSIRDSMAENSARGDYVGPFPGVVRPLLQWELAQSEEQDETV